MLVNPVSMLAVVVSSHLVDLTTVAVVASMADAADLATMEATHL